MKQAFVACFACALVAAAGTAGAQSAAPAPSPAPERQGKSGDSGLNLKLDETSNTRPRILFGPRDTTTKPPAEADAASTLPSLGAEPGRAPSFERPLGTGKNPGGGGGGGPFPKDTNPGL
ncbi:MAG TPA: hypothetical protein VF943_07125 [Burkholderiales bacterium]